MELRDEFTSRDVFLAGVKAGREVERAELVEWLRANSNSCCHAGDHYAEALETGEDPWT